LTSDRPGRFSDGVSSQRSALDPQQSKMEHELHDYLREVADKVSAFQRSDGFEQIDLIAEPGTLGPLRQAIAKHKNLKVSKEVHHDIVNLSEPEMLKKAKEYLSI